MGNLAVVFPPVEMHIVGQPTYSGVARGWRVVMWSVVGGVAGGNEESGLTFAGPFQYRCFFSFFSFCFRRESGAEYAHD